MTDSDSPSTTTTAPPSAKLDASKAGLRKRGGKPGGASLTASLGELIECYWPADGADLVQLLLDDKVAAGPDRATDGSCPIPLSGLAAGTYNYKLIPGFANAGPNVWANDNAIALALTLIEGVAFKSFTADPEPDNDGKDHPPQDLQLANGTKVKLQFEAPGAKQVQIYSGAGSGDAAPLDPIDLDENGKGDLVVDPAGAMTSYTAVAINGEARSAPAGPLTVHFHDPDDVVSTVASVNDSAFASLTIAADERGAGTSDGDSSSSATGDATCDCVRIGAGDGVRLGWSVACAKSAKLTAKLLVDRAAVDATGAGPDATGAGPQVSQAQLLSSGLELPVPESGVASGFVIVDPGPRGSTVYSLAVTSSEARCTDGLATATAYVASFNVQLKLPDGSGFAKNGSCVLEIPGQAPIRGTTNSRGELWLWLPNITARAALRLVNGDDTAAEWTVNLRADPAIAIGALAIDASGAADPSGAGTTPCPTT